MKVSDQIKSFLKPVTIVFAAILLVAFLYWWFGGPHTKERLETNIFVAGAIAIGIGAFLRMASRNGTYQIISSQSYMVSKTTIEERMKQGSDDLERSWADLMVLSAAGILAIFLSIMLSFFTKR